MQKKSQFYMFAAILFISAAYVIFTAGSIIKVNINDDFEIYRDNYVYEAKNVINNAIRNNDNISDQLKNYTENFLAYSGNKDLGIGVCYLYSRDEMIHIVNYLKRPVLIKTAGLSINYSQETATDYSETVEIEYYNELYSFTFNGALDTEFKTLFVKQNE